MAESTAGEGDGRLTVYYDGGCPICTSEVRFYRAQEGGDLIEWVNLQTAPEEDLDGVNREAALKKLHARDEEGRILEGVPAFAGILERLPRLSFLGRLLNTPPVSWLFQGAYRLFLLLRPGIQRLARAAGVKPENP